MSQPLTKREQEVLDIIKNTIKEKKYPPSVREIGKKAGLRSSSTVHNYLRRLEEKQYIRRDPTKPRAIEVLEMEHNRYRNLNWVPVLGRVAAGEPILAVENREAYFPLPADFAGDGEFYMLTIKGDSMIEAGIFEGDLVIVKKASMADNGEIVVALVEDEATVKRFFKEKDHVRLQPENSSMEPIYVRDVTILGRVVGLLRKIEN